MPVLPPELPVGRDRCSMAVGSRPRTGSGVAIDARWLWDQTRSSRCRDRCSMAVGSRLAWSTADYPIGSRSMLDGCGIETRGPSRCARPPSVAIDARWLWDRDSPTLTQLSERRVAIDARWLWDRDPRVGDAHAKRRDRCSMRDRDIARSRSMLDGCGIETRRGAPMASSAVAIDARWLWIRSRSRAAARAIDARWVYQTAAAEARSLGSRSMLDGCGIETRWSTRLRGHSVSRVAIDARWLWDRDRSTTS